MRPATIRKLINRYVRDKQEGDDKAPEFYAGVMIGPPCPEDTEREPRYANEERWDWWKTYHRETGS